MASSFSGSASGAGGVITADSVEGRTSLLWESGTDVSPDSTGGWTASTLSGRDGAGGATAGSEKHPSQHQSITSVPIPKPSRHLAIPDSHPPPSSIPFFSRTYPNPT